MSIRLRIIALALLSLFSALSPAKTLTIAAIDWCPQICPNAEKPGYITEIVQAVYAGSPYQLTMEYYPWSRAIKLTKEGKADALLSPARAEAPTLLFPDNEVGIQRMCFFTPKASTWQYKGPDSLQGLQIGIGADTSAEELNSYVHQHPEQFQVQPYLDRYIIQNAKKLDKKRIDTFLFTYNSTIYELARHGIGQHYRSAGCVSTTNVYMAFSPNSHNPDIAKMMQLFDKKYLQLQQQGKIDEIMAKYGLRNWRASTSPNTGH